MFLCYDFAQNYFVVLNAIQHIYLLALTCLHSISHKLKKNHKILLHILKLYVESFIFVIALIQIAKINIC